MFGIPFVLIILIMFCLSDGWWARYSPQVWFIPLMAVFMLLFDNKKVMKFLGIVLLTLCLNNSYIIVKQMINIRIPSSRVIRQAMKKNRGREIEIQLLNPHFTGTLFNLKDFDIKYKIKDKLSNANSLYSDKISYVDEKVK